MFSSVDILGIVAVEENILLLAVVVDVDIAEHISLLLQLFNHLEGYFFEGGSGTYLV